MKFPVAALSELQELQRVQSAVVRKMRELKESHSVSMSMQSLASKITVRKRNRTPKRKTNMTAFRNFKSNIDTSPQARNKAGRKSMKNKENRDRNQRKYFAARRMGLDRTLPKKEQKILKRKLEKGKRRVAKKRRLSTSSSSSDSDSLE